MDPHETIISMLTLQLEHVSVLNSTFWNSSPSFQKFKLKDKYVWMFALISLLIICWVPCSCIHLRTRRGTITMGTSWKKPSDWMENCVTLKRIQGVLWRHVDIAVIDITQHGLKGLLTWNHLTNRDINLPILRHEGAKHSLKVTGEQKYKC